jgi:hypothetical protein
MRATKEGKPSLISFQLCNAPQRIAPPRRATLRSAAQRNATFLVRQFGLNTEGVKDREDR